MGMQILNYWCLALDVYTTSTVVLYICMHDSWHSTFGERFVGSCLGIREWRRLLNFIECIEWAVTIQTYVFYWLLLFYVLCFFCFGGWGVVCILKRFFLITSFLETKLSKLVQIWKMGSEVQALLFHWCGGGLVAVPGAIQIFVHSINLHVHAALKEPRDPNASRSKSYLGCATILLFYS